MDDRQPRVISNPYDFLLKTMRELANADGGSLWVKTVGHDGQARLSLVATQIYSIDRDTFVPFSIPVDEKSVVGYAVTMDSSLNYDDAYNPPPDKPQAGRAFDKQFGYRTKSMLTVPVRSQSGDVTCVIQLVNAKRRFETRLTLENLESEVVSFRRGDIEMIESIWSQAGIAFEKERQTDAHLAAFDGVVRAIVIAIEQADPAVAGHSVRGAELATGLALGVSDTDAGKYGGVRFTEDQLTELRYACLLHQCGMLAVPEQVRHKAKKLMAGQLESIRSRFESAEHSVVAKHALAKLQAAKEQGFDSRAVRDEDIKLERQLQLLREWSDVIAIANEPAALCDAHLSALEAATRATYTDIGGNARPLLTPQEFSVLSIRRGVLDEHERLELESHVIRGYEFLSAIPWPASLRRIPEIVYGHHEKLDGSGYPRRLTADRISLQTRMLTIADIYDALTVQDRPYRRALPVERALDILRSEADHGKLDRDLLDVFIAKRIYELTAPR